MRSENKSAVRGLICLIVGLLILGGLVACNEPAYPSRVPAGTEKDPFETVLFNQPNCAVTAKICFDPAALENVTADERAAVAAAVAQLEAVPDGTFPMMQEEFVRREILDKIERRQTTLEAVAARATEYWCAVIPADETTLTVRVTECVTDPGSEYLQTRRSQLDRRLTDVGLDPEKVGGMICFTVAYPSAEMDGMFRTRAEDDDVTTFAYLYDGTWYLDPAQLDDDLLDVGMGDPFAHLEPVTVTGIVRWVRDGHFRMDDDVIRVTDPELLRGIEPGDSVSVVRYLYVEARVVLTVEEQDDICLYNAVSLEKN